MEGVEKEIKDFLGGRNSYCDSAQVRVAAEGVVGILRHLKYISSRGQTGVVWRGAVWACAWKPACLLKPHQ